MKPILVIIFAVLIGGSAAAADLELNCTGVLAERGPLTRHIQFVLWASARDVILRADPKYELGGPPDGSALKLRLKKSDATVLEFESIERMKRPGHEARARVFGVFYRNGGAITVRWREDEPRGRYLSGRCEFLMGSPNIVPPKVT